MAEKTKEQRLETPIKETKKLSRKKNYAGGEKRL